MKKKKIIILIILCINILATNAIAVSNISNNITNKNTLNTNDNNTTKLKENSTINVTASQKSKNASINIDQIKLKYQTHVQDIGWQSWVQDGKTAGTEGKSKRLEAIKIDGTLPNGGEIEYQTHIQDIGWQNWVKTGKISGTEGKSKRLEAIRIVLKNMDEYTVKYRVHVQNIGWQNWVENGALAGTTGKGLRLEAIQIKIEKKVEKGIIKIETKQSTFDENKINMSGYKLANVKNTTIKTYLDGTEVNGNVKYIERNDINKEGYGESLYNKQPGFNIQIDTSKIKDGKHKITFRLYNEKNQKISEVSKDIKIDNGTMKVKYQGHLSNIGWQGWKQNSETAGTTGQSRAIEGIYIKISGTSIPANASIEYQAHVSDIGWQNWTSDGKLAGTTGKSKSMEAIKIRLKNMDKYTVMYRTHVQDIGWQDWALDGEISGTTGQGKRIEAIEIKIQAKNNTEKATSFIDYPSATTIEKGQYQIKGWEMSNTNTTIKIYINNQLLNSQIGRTNRQDVLDKVKGYGGEEKNPKPGFYTNIDFNKYNAGTYKLRVDSVSNKTGKTLYTSETTINLINKITFEKGTYGKTGLAVKGDSRGSNLTYYKIGKGPNVLFATFAIHGYEDIWSKDGKELITIAENFKDHLLKIRDQELNDKWTIYIFPGINLDGINYGTTNNGPGRTTLYSAAPNHKGIDINRSWATETQYKRYTSNRNYNGTEAYQAYEIRYLKDFLLKNKAKNGGQTVLIDLHGWTTQLIGDQEICLNYFGPQFYSSQSAALSRYTSSYGKQYMIGWARKNLGANGVTARSALIELPSAGINGHDSVVSAKYSEKYINATINMLKGIK